MRVALGRSSLMAACLVLGCGSLLAQGHGRGMGGRRGTGMPGQGDFTGNAPNVRSGVPNVRGDGGTRGASGNVRGGLQLGPPGRWWDDQMFARTLGLRKDQQQRMDTVFNANKGAIVESFRALQLQESRLEAATHDQNLDEGRIFACIDGVNQARSALEKANAHMLLLVRQEMEPDQIDRMGKLQDKPVDE